jgi:hypothetical protein
MSEIVGVLRVRGNFDSYCSSVGDVDKFMFASLQSEEHALQ